MSESNRLSKFANIANAVYNSVTANSTAIININANSISNTVYVAANGNVGIGTAGPTVKLEVNGAATVGGALTGGSIISSSNTLTVGTSAFFVSNGNVGIGNTSPVDKLRVEGNISTSGTLSMEDQNLIRPIIKDGAVSYFNSNTTNSLDYTNGSHQRWAPNTGAQTLSISNWPPSGTLGELLIEGVNLGAATITWPAAINWIKSDGTTTTTFANNGVTLQSSGIDWTLLWTRDAGTTIYGKIVR